MSCELQRGWQLINPVEAININIKIRRYVFRYKCIHWQEQDSDTMESSDNKKTQVGFLKDTDFWYLKHGLSSRSIPAKGRKRPLIDGYILRLECGFSR